MLDITEEFQSRAIQIGVTLALAGANRLDAVEDLWLALFDHQQSVMTVPLPVISRDQTWARRRAAYQSLLADTDSFLLLALRADNPIGYAMVHVRAGFDDTWDTSSRIAELESLAVLPDTRGTGLGPLLLDVVDDHLVGLGVTDMRLSVMAGNDSAHDFYLKRGFVDTLTVMGRHQLPRTPQCGE